jgi:hypothetical protein
MLLAICSFIMEEMKELQVKCARVKNITLPAKKDINDYSCLGACPLLEGLAIESSTVVLLNSLESAYCFYDLCDGQLNIYGSSYFIYLCAWSSFFIF